MKRLPLSISAVVVAAMIVANLAGCRRSTPTSGGPSLASTKTRASRRAFDGAPPVIPHPPLGASCLKCHTQTGMAVPSLGYAPANPHGEASSQGLMQNCRQCHLFKQSDALLVQNRFQGIQQVVSDHAVAYPGAPPMMPHPMQMRENCASCHTGPSARPEIVCDHPDRVNCVQCHLPVSSQSVAFTKQP